MSNNAYRAVKSLTSAGTTAATGIIFVPTGLHRGAGIQILGTFTATLSFEQTFDNGTTWVALTVYPYNGGSGVTSTTGTGYWKCNLSGVDHIRVRASAYTSGTAEVNIVLTTGSHETAAGTAGLGSKAPSASLSVVPTGLEYETVAASQTAQVLGATGAAGDFLSHVIIQPVTTAAGTVTILDNATVIFTFTTGTLSDLRPIVVPVGAFSVSGAWKITTGANVTATGFGDFT